MKILEVWDYILSPIYIFIIYQLARSRAKRKIKVEPYYKYFANGILAKMLGGVALCLIYEFYYGGGDTTAYFLSAVSMTKLIFRHSDAFWRLMFGANPLKEYRFFDSVTGFPQYWRDTQSWQVVRWTTIFAFAGARCYILTTITLAASAYYGIWKLFKVFMFYFPELARQVGIAILFIPSVLFWGSGVLKDTYTLSAAALFTYAFHNFFITKKSRVSSGFVMVFCSSLLLSIKPYIFLGLVPGALLWVSFSRIKGIQSTVMKILIGPIVFLFTSGLAILGYGQIKDDLGHYSSVDKILDKASVTQKDLKQEYNQGNSFDIGEFDPTLGGVISKFPKAAFAGLFRPSIIDVKNVVMSIAAVENTYMLFLLISTIYKLGPIQFYRAIISEPIIFFALIFSVFFAFSVGLTTSNFGALVRYKIPAVPFFIAAMLILRHKENIRFNPYKTAIAKRFNKSN